MLLHYKTNNSFDVPQAVLERLLQQLVAVHREAVEANGGQGEPFQLHNHLPPEQPLAAVVASQATPPSKSFIAHENGTNGMLQI